MSTLAVVEHVLRETEVPMSVREIVERAGDGLPTKSKTPDTVVARDLSMDIKKRGEASIFIRTSPGRYTMRDIHVRKLADTGAGDTESTERLSDRPTAVLSSAMGHERAATLSAKKTPSEQKESAAQSST